MKKIVVSAVFAVAGLISLGGILSYAYAQTATPVESESITPQQAVILNQELESMKIVLAEMQQKYPLPQEIEEPTPIAFTQEELSALSVALGDIKDEITALAEKVQFSEIAPERISLLQSALSDLSNNLIAIGLSVRETAPEIAESSAPSAITTLPRDDEIGTGQQPQKETLAGSVNQEASAVSLFSLRNLLKPATIGTIIGIIIAGLGLWLWRRKAEKKEMPVPQ